MLRNQRGQEEAPFELLIGVIVMGFVIVIGLMALVNLRNAQCVERTELSLNALKLEIENAVSQKSTTQFSFNLSGCFNPEKEKVLITDSETLCKEYCETDKITCSFLEYYNDSPEYTGQRPIRKCLGISPEAVFQDPTSQGKCESIDNAGARYELVNFKDGIPEGFYKIINKSSAMDIHPVICAYREIS